MPQRIIEPPSRGRPFALALGVVVAVSSLWAYRCSGAATPRASSAETSQAAAGAPSPDGLAPRALGPRAPAFALDHAILSADALREALASYERDSQYPPSSHRFTEDNAAQMMREWNDPITSDLGFDDREGLETVVRFHADRNHVGFGEALTTTIEVWPAAEPERRLPVEVRSAVILATGGARTGRTHVSLVYRDDGLEADAVAGDGIYTNRFVPSEHESLDRALRVHISATIEAGGVERIVTRDFAYTPRPLLDLTGVQTAAVAGSLAVNLDLFVHEPGLYLLFCEVYAADGTTPIGWITEHWTDLAAGDQEVSLSLFGKVLRDQGIAGPYVIRGIRAMKRDTDLDLAAWWSDPREFRTHPFELAEFSPAPWDAPERREVIATLEQSIREQDEAERRHATGF